MDADSLNGDNQREILAMKNKLQIKLINLDEPAENF